MSMNPDPFSPLPSRCYKAALTVFLVLMLAFPASGLCAWYVVPSAEIPLRTGQGMEYRIIELVPDGTKVELLEEGDKWVRIRTPKGNEGWILRRYLSDQTPLRDVVASLRVQRDKLQKKAAGLSDELSRAQKELDRCRSRLSGCTGERDQVQLQYEELRRDAADVLQIKQALEQTTDELNVVRQELAAAREENARLKNDERIKWFMAGGGILLVGWCIGLVMGRGRRRRSTLL